MPKQKALAFILSVLSAPLAADITFEDISTQSGVDQFRTETWGAAVGDFNNDGYPDIYVGNHVAPAVLLQNNGNNRFSDASLFADATKAWSRQYNKRVDEHAAAWGDYDNDGDLDLMTANGFAQPFFENRDGKLYQIPNKVEGVHWATQNVWLDNDNDGDLDVFFTAPLESREPRYYRNNAGVFNYESNYTASTGIECAMQMAAISDFDADGQIDVACGTQNGNWSHTGDFFSLTGNMAQRKPGLPQSKPVRDAVVADFDGDLRADIFNIRGSLRPSDIYQDDSRSFSAHINAQATKVKTLVFKTTGILNIDIDWNKGDNPCRSRGPEIAVGAGKAIVAQGGKFDNFSATLDPANSAYHGLSAPEDCAVKLGYMPAEGAWHIRMGGRGSNFSYIRATSTSAITDLSIDNVELMDAPVYPKYFLNKANGFQDVSFSHGFAKVKCVSAVAGDFDNDMDLDLYLACRAGAANLANVLYENDGNGRFNRVNNAGGAEGVVGVSQESNGQGAGNSDSVVSADFDLDGFLDLFVTNGLNLRPHDGGGPYNLFRNRANANHWLQFDLRGVQSNRDGIGAKVFIKTPDGKTQLREQNGGFHRWSQNHMRIHVGLAANTQAQVRVEWPSGHVDTFSAVAANAIYRLSEGGAISALQRSTPPPMPCGKPGLNSGVLLWKNCFNGKWMLQSTGTAIAGSVEAQSGTTLNLLRSVQLETNDLALLQTAQQLSFSFDSTGQDKDAVEFDFADTGAVCLQLDDKAQTLLVGANALPWRGGLNLATMQACEVGSSDRIDIVGDDEFTVYVNGEQIGSGSEGDLTYHWDRALAPGDVIALEVTDQGGAGGVLANLHVDGTDYPSSAAWKIATTQSLGWFLSDFDDSAWPAASEHGAYGTAPWNQVREWSHGNNAQWIWGDDIHSLNKVYLRFRIPKSDRDRDGVPDDEDAFPDDPSESSDRDNDGVGDNSDVFPDDPTESKDSDGDGLGDNSDPYPNDPTNGGSGGTPVVSEVCGEPAWSRNDDKALLLWRDCTHAQIRWHVRLSGGGTSQRLDASGYFIAPTAIIESDGISLEGSDVVDTSVAEKLDYQFIVYNIGVDGLALTLPAGACFKHQLPDDLDVLVGPNRELLNNDSMSLALDSRTECASESDQDGDGLSDAQEALLGTDPLIADTDAGGIDDGSEVAQGTDPLDPADDEIDTDGDGLSDAREAQLGTDPALVDTDGDKLNDGLEVNTHGTDPLRVNTDRDGLSDWAEIKFFSTDPLKADTDDDGLKDGPERKTYQTDPLKPDTDDGGVNDGDEVSRGSNPLDAADD